MSKTLEKQTEIRPNIGEHGHNAGASGADSLPGSGASVPAYAQSDQLSITTPKRRPWKLIVPVVLVIIAAIVAGYVSLRPAPAAPSASVSRGTIISTVETTGKLQAETSAKLAFQASGRVAQVFLNPGDAVKKGDIIAELDTAQLNRQLSEANIQLQISNLRLEQAKAGPPEADIQAANANLKAAQADLDRLKAGPKKEEVDAAQATLNQAQAKLDALKKGPHPQDLSAAQARLDQAKSQRDIVATTAANTTEQARITMQQAASANQNWLDPDSRYEQARLNYEAAQKNEAAQVAAADAAVREAEAGLNKVKAGASPDEVKQAQEGVTIARANLDRVKRGATTEDLAAAQAKVDAARSNLDKVKAGPTDTDVAILEQQAKLALISVTSAEAQVGDAQLKSPIDGTLLTLTVEVGETVGGQQQVASVADTKSLRIKGDVDEIDVGKVTAGQAVTVTLDAYPGVTMPGKIEKLAPGATQKQGSTVYQATISFTPGEGVTPREGMAANVDITAQRKDNVLLLPNRAFETVGRRQYVTISENGTTRKVEVETGLSNNTDTEVVSGLSEGQQVVIK